MKKAPSLGARTFSAATVKGFSVTVPTQSNLCDCGVFVLHFVEKFVENLPRVDRHFVETKGGDMMGKGWFNELDIANKRITTIDLIRRKCSEQEQEHFRTIDCTLPGSRR